MLVLRPKGRRCCAPGSGALLLLKAKLCPDPVSYTHLYGQTYEKYLRELKNVFSQIYERTKANGTLWVIIDTLNKNGQVIPLPFDFSAKIQECGWKFKEIIIWEKDKTVPWTHKGQMRNSFEYILLFSKTDNFNFFIDKIRDYESLKQWWVKYPERYNPKGKTPEAIWQDVYKRQGFFPFGVCTNEYFG